ncbi:hypothetical protein [Maricaulis sp. CAU 1757]
MAAIDRESFDGTKPQEDLQAACGFKTTRTQISLIASAIDGFVVVTGSDEGHGVFDDEAISSILLTFSQVVDDHPGATAGSLRIAVQQALAGHWKPCGAVNPCPFDQDLQVPTRMIFHVYSPGWGFEAARLKFKGKIPAGEFCGLAWLQLNGAGQQPYSFELSCRASEAAKYEFALYIKASQDAGNQSTRVIIDPLIKVTPD